MYSLVGSQRATAHTLQNVSEVNRERSRLVAASSVCDSTKHNGLVTCASVAPIILFYFSAGQGERACCQRASI